MTSGNVDLMEVVMCGSDAHPVCDLAAPAVRLAVAASDYRQNMYVANGAVVHVFRDVRNARTVRVVANADGVVEVVGDADLWHEVHVIASEVCALIRSAGPTAGEVTELVAAA